MWLPADFLGSLAGTHRALDRGALPLAHCVRALVDGNIVEAAMSRLVVDVNRELNSGAIPSSSPLSAGDLASRRTAHRDFHRDLQGQISNAQGDGLETLLIDLHTFSRMPATQRRAVDIGVCIPPENPGLSLSLLNALASIASSQRSFQDYEVRANEPYSGSHAGAFISRSYSQSGVHTATIEVCDDCVTSSAAIRTVSQFLSNAIRLVVQQFANRDGNIERTP